MTLRVAIEDVISRSVVDVGTGQAGWHPDQEDLGRLWNAIRTGTHPAVELSVTIRRVVRKMAILVCRVAWMASYQSEDEPGFGGGGYVVKGNVPAEALNFHPVGNTYYGYVANRGRQIRLETNFGAERDAATVEPVSVVFCATDPDTDDFLVVGWYTDATVYRQPIRRPGDSRKRGIYFRKPPSPVIEWDSVNPRMPSKPRLRPIPDILKPPNGARPSCDSGPWLLR